MDYKSKNRNFTVLKDLTEKIKKTNKNFVYAFEMTRSSKNSYSTKLGFVIKNEDKKDSYTFLYISGLEDLMDLYYQKESELNLLELEYIFDKRSNRFRMHDTDVIDIKDVNNFKSKFYYEIFKNDYLDYYLNKYNLKIRKLVTNIFD